MSHYVTVHKRLREQRGRASTHPCVGCGGPAEQWAYLYNGQPELVAPGGQGTLYAEDIGSCYAPMCRKCHRQFDRNHDPKIANYLEGAGSRVAAARIARAGQDEAFARKMSRNGTRSVEIANQMRRKCDECGLVTTPPALASHQKWKGHSGYTLAVQTTPVPNPEPGTTVKPSNRERNRK